MNVFIHNGQVCGLDSLRKWATLENMGYTKLFSDIVASTIWRESNATRLVWITMLAMKDERHMVRASIPGLADLARVSVDEYRAAIEKFKAPDVDSRNREHEGKRIVEADGGWYILNGEFYKRLMSAEERREYKRKWQANYRQKQKVGWNKKDPEAIGTEGRVMPSDMHPGEGGVV